MRLSLDRRLNSQILELGYHGKLMQPCLQMGCIICSRDE